MSQSRKHSVAEALTNTASGFAISWFAGLVIYPLLGMQVSLAQNTAAVLAFTVVSLLRTYVLRRWFNRLVAKPACARPPAGWYCTRTPGHDGPCAAHPGDRKGGVA